MSTPARTSWLSALDSSAGGAPAGLRWTARSSYVFEIVAGKLKRLRPFETQAEAIEAAGLPE
jgi:hypothetical protein